MGFSSPVTASSLGEPSWLVAECVTDGGAVHDSADRLAACDGMIPPEDLRASMSWIQLRSQRRALIWRGCTS